MALCLDRKKLTMSAIESSRVSFRESVVATSGTLFLPFCPDALTARLCGRLGFSGGYVSGAGLGYSLALSEALLNSRDLADVVMGIRRRSDLPIVVDGGVGFGDAIHLQRTVWELEAAGAHAIEIEDQVAPKRASHHRGIEHLESLDVMVKKIRYAAEARRDVNCLLIARTGAIQNESIDSAIRRGNAYAAAGADVVMLLATDKHDYEIAVEKINCPIATLAPFDDRSRDEWGNLGLRIVIDPQTGHAVAFAAMARAYEQQAAGGLSGLDGPTLEKARSLFADLTDLKNLYAIEDETVEAQ